MKVAQMKNTPDVHEREAQLIAEIAAWSAIAEVELAELGPSRALLKKVLAMQPRRSATCSLAARRCRHSRRSYALTRNVIASLELQLAYLRGNEHLPF